LLHFDPRLKEFLIAAANDQTPPGLTDKQWADAKEEKRRC